MCQAAARQTFGAGLPSHFLHEIVVLLDEFSSHSSAAQGTLHFFPGFFSVSTFVLTFFENGITSPSAGAIRSSAGLLLGLGVWLSHQCHPLAFHASLGRHLARNQLLEHFPPFSRKQRENSFLSTSGSLEPSICAI